MSDGRMNQAFGIKSIENVYLNAFNELKKSTKKCNETITSDKQLLNSSAMLGLDFINSIEELIKFLTVYSPKADQATRELIDYINIICDVLHSINNKESIEKGMACLQRLDVIAMRTAVANSQLRAVSVSAARATVGVVTGMPIGVTISDVANDEAKLRAVKMYEQNIKKPVENKTRFSR